MADNPYYQDPYLAKIASNIAGIFVDKNPGQTLVNREHAGVLRQQSEKLTRENQGRSKLGALFRSQTLDPREIGAVGIESDVPVGQVSGYTLYNKSNTGAPDSEIARAFVGSGKGLSKGEGVSLEDRNSIAQRDNDEAARRTSISAGPGYASVAEQRRYHDQEAAFKEKTRFDAPIHVSPGSGLILTPGDARKPSDMIDGEVAVPVPARPSADKFVQSEGPGGKNVWRQATDGLPGPAAKPPAPTDISPTEANDIELHALNDLGAVETNDAGKPVAINAEFRKMYGPKLEGAKMAAARAYQTTRDAAQGARAYREYLGIPVGSTLDKGGWFSDPSMVPPGGVAVPPPNTPAPSLSPRGADGRGDPTPSATLPPSAAAALKEGVQTKFGNGQVWTKQNGVPVQVQ